jgi:hypothetical protein
MIASSEFGEAFRNSGSSLILIDDDVKISLSAIKTDRITANNIINFL